MLCIGDDVHTFYLEPVNSLSARNDIMSVTKSFLGQPFLSHFQSTFDICNYIRHTISGTHLSNSNNLLLSFSPEVICSAFHYCRPFFLELKEVSFLTTMALQSAAVQCSSSQEEYPLENMLLCSQPNCVFEAEEHLGILFKGAFFYLSNYRPAITT